MKTDQRLWRTLHVLIHMNQQDSPMTSQAIAKMLNTNPVVVRRTLSGLRDKNWIHSEKGHGGGWRLACSLEQLSLQDVYEALNEPPIVNFNSANDSQGCLVEKAVHEAVDEVLEQARDLIMQRFKGITVAQIEKDFQVLYKQHCQK